MKKKISLKICLTIVVSLILLVMLSTTANATTGDLEVIKSGDDYVFYIEGYESAKFQFAFSNDSTTNVTDLEFTNNWTDNNNVYVACLDSEMKIDLTKDVFMWIQNENAELVLEAKKIDLTNVLTREDMISLESLTKLIKVDSNGSVTTTEEVDGVTISKTVGKMEITDDENCTYKYSLLKVEDKKEITEFLTTLDQVSEDYSDMTMVEKIRVINKLNNNYSNLLQNVTWNEVADMTITQPEESVQGDKYIVFLQKTNGETVEATDLQMLNCSENEETVKETEKVPVKVTTKLPVTGEDITLYVILGIILFAIVVIFIRMIIIKRKNKNEVK